MWHLYYALKKPSQDDKDIQHFDVGGQVAASPGSLQSNGSPLTTTGHDTMTGGQVFQNGVNSTPYGSIPGVSGAAGWLGNSAANVTHGAGDIVKGIGSAFTVQNQYDAQLAPTDYTNYQGTIGQSGANALAGFGQFQNNQNQQQNVADQMQSTAGQYQNIANGQGPNPAINQLNQATGANNAQTASQMASMRGTSRNPGMIARQAGMAGAANQQAAAGQAATLRSQQQLAGLSGLQSQQQNLANTYGNMGAQIQGEQGANTSLYGTAAGAQNQQNANSIANYGMEQGINSQIAQNNANAANKTTAGFMDMAGKAAMLAKGGKVKKMADGGNPGWGANDIPYAPTDADTPASTKSASTKTTPAKTDPAQTPFQKGLSGSNLGASTMGGSISTPYASGFSNAAALQDAPKKSMSGQQQKKKDPNKSDVWNHLNSDIASNKDYMAGAPAQLDNKISPASPLDVTAQQPMVLAADGGSVPNLMSSSSSDDDDKKSGNGGIMSMFSGMMSNGGKVPAMVSPGERYLSPHEAQAVAKGKANPEKLGKVIPGKAKVKGDSYKNDTVRTTLEAGGCVIPKSIMESDNPMKHSIAFVRAHMSRATALKGKKK